MGALSNDDIYNEDFSRQVTNPWVKLSPDEWGSLTEGLYPTRFDKNTVIYHQGDMLRFAFIVKAAESASAITARPAKKRGF